MEKESIMEKLIDNQNKFNRKVNIPKIGDKIGFAFSTKDRVDFTIKSLDSIDTEKGFDIIWVDGSVTTEGRDLPKNYKFKNVNLAKYYLNVGGGPDAAIQYGLRKLLELGYDYCGLIENDIVFETGWFKKLIELFDISAKEGLVPGAVTVRNFNTRVIEYNRDYTINWNIGAGMILFTREAAQLVLDNYKFLAINGIGMRRYYGKLLGFDLKDNKELFGKRLDYFLSMDYSYDRVLYKNGFCSVGTIPSMVVDLEFDIPTYGLSYVTKDKNNIGPVFNKISRVSLLWLSIIDPFFYSLCFIWRRLRKVKRIRKIGKNIEKKILNKK